MFMNYYKLPNGPSDRLHFDDYHKVASIIHDPELGKDKPATRHVFWIDKINGERAAQTLSVLSDGLWQQLKPYVDNNTFREYEFVITKEGEARLTKYSVEVFPTTEYTKKNMIGS